MATPDLDYAKVTGRFAIMVGDTPDDPDENPDLVYLDSGQVIFTPNTSVVHTLDNPPLIFTPAPVTATINGTGQLSINGMTDVYLLDLGSAKVNPSTGRDKGAWTVSFKNLKAGTANVTLPQFSFNPVAGQENDLGAAQPLPAAGGAAIVRGPEGPAGPGVPDTSTAQDGWVVTYDVDTGMTIWAAPTGSVDLSGYVTDADLTTALATKADSNAIPAPSDGQPRTLGTADPGVGTAYARYDHVHPMPTAADVGALPSSTAIPATAADVGAVPATRTVAGHALTADVTLAKGDVGLGSVDNTSDADKPVSTAQQTALDGKVTADGITTVSKVTQAQYDALTPDPGTLYVVVG